MIPGTGKLWAMLLKELINYSDASGMHWLAENVMWLYDVVNTITGLPAVMRVIETAKTNAWKYLLFSAVEIFG